MFVLQMKSKVFFIQSKKLPECRRLLFPLLHAERDLKNGLIHKNRKLWLSWDRENNVFAQKMGSITRHRIGYNRVGALRDQQHRETDVQRAS